MKVLLSPADRASIKSNETMIFGSSSGTDKPQNPERIPREIIPDLLSFEPDTIGSNKPTFQPNALLPHRDDLFNEFQSSTGAKNAVQEKILPDGDLIDLGFEKPKSSSPVQAAEEPLRHQSEASNKHFQTSSVEAKEPVAEVSKEDKEQTAEPSHKPLPSIIQLHLDGNPNGPVTLGLPREDPQTTFGASQKDEAQLEFLNNTFVKLLDPSASVIKYQNFFTKMTTSIKPVVNEQAIASAFSDLQAAIETRNPSDSLAENMIKLRIAFHLSASSKGSTMEQCLKCGAADQYVVSKTPSLPTQGNISYVLRSAVENAEALDKKLNIEAFIRAYHDNEIDLPHESESLVFHTPTKQAVQRAIIKLYGANSLSYYHRDDASTIVIFQGEIKNALKDEVLAEFERTLRIRAEQPGTRSSVRSNW